MIRFLLLLAASSAALAAGANAAPIRLAQNEASMPSRPAKAEPDRASGATSSYGAVLAGRAAMNDGLSDKAFSYYDRVSDLETDPFLRGRAFNAALLSGEVTRAAALAPLEAGEDAPAYRLGRLTRMVEALASGKGKEAQALTTGEGIGFPHRSAGALLAPWAAALNRDVAGSLVRPDVKSDRLVAIFGQLGQALLYERAGKYAEADADYQALNAMGGVSGLFVLDYGGYLERRGRRPEAIALYDSALGASPDDSELIEARARAAAGKPAPALPTLRQGAAKMLTAPAAAAMSEKNGAVAMAYLRMVIRLDPERADAWLLVGDILAASGDTAGARDAYGRVPAEAGQYVQARGKLAWTYQAAGDKDQALKIASETAKAYPQNQEAQVTLIDLLRAAEKYDQAVSVADALIARAGAAPDWRLLYIRGAALDQAGRWPEAERDLQAAIKQNPDEPQLLNFLGYSWIDRGVNLPQALDMVKRASAANPRSGAILDSLGWAYFRTGDFANAVETLERAVEIEPGDPDVNNHLGDAYWRVGRKDEARFQWRRVLTLEPDPKTKADAEEKLKGGLRVAPGTIASAEKP